MHGQRVGAEGIEHDQLIGMIGRVIEALPGIAQDDVDRFGLAISQIGEEPRIAGDPLHGGVDFVKRPALAGLGIARQGSRP